MNKHNVVRRDMLFDMRDNANGTLATSVHFFFIILINTIYKQ